MYILFGSSAVKIVSIASRSVFRRGGLVVLYYVTYSKRNVAIVASTGRRRHQSEDAINLCEILFRSDRDKTRFWAYQTLEYGICTHYFTSIYHFRFT